MSILSKHLAFVNEQVGVQTRLAKKYAKDVERSALHVKARDGFVDLLAAMVEADTALDATASQETRVQQPVLTLDASDLEGLPAEVVAELSDGAVPDKADAALLQVLTERGGIASLDQIIVGLYRKTGEIVKRNTLTSKLYRMAQKGTIFPVPDRKGVYSLRRLSDDDVRRMFGEERIEVQPTLV